MRTEKKRPAQAVLWILACLLSIPAAAQKCPQPVWSDEFGGNALDETKWSYQLGDSCPGLCGWGNDELEYYQAENVAVRGGVLRITARAEQAGTRSYTSGRIRSLGKGEWTSGRFEARMRLPRGQGIWPAFWMLPTDEIYGGWPRSGEIDIMENVGYEPATVHGTIHFGEPWPNNSSQGASFRLAEGAFADGFHEFAVERDEGAIRWYVDDVLVASWTAQGVAPFTWPFDERFHFLLNLAVGGNWPGSPDATTVFPQALVVDYVRVYDRYLPSISGPRDAFVEDKSTYTISNPLPGSSYTWRVPEGARIVSGQGTRALTVSWGTSGGDVVAEVKNPCGAKTYTMTVAVREPAELPRPDGLSSTVLTPSRILLEWADNSDSEELFEVGLRVGAGPWQDGAVVAADVEQVIFRRLVPGTKYRFRVRARSSEALSAWSPLHRVTLPSELGRPEALRAAVLSPSSVRLEWRDRSEGEDDFEIGARIPPGLWEDAGAAGADAEQYVLTDLLPGFTYVFRIRARSGSGLSEWRQTSAVLPSG